MTLSELGKSPVDHLLSQEAAISPVNAQLQDFSLQRRTGLRGPDAASVFTELGLKLPDMPNRIIPLDASIAVMRLSATECWLLNTACERLPNNLSEPVSIASSLNKTGLFEALPDLAVNKKACYPLMCQFSHAWFVLHHPDRAKIMAQLCGVDLRPIAFPLGSVAQTSMAKVSVIIASHAINGREVFSIFCDSAIAEYLWRELKNCLVKFHS